MTKKKVKSILDAKISHFKITLPFLTREYKVLDNLGTYEKIGDDQYEWTFKYDDWDNVQNSLAGRILEHDRDHLMRDVLKHCDPLIKEVNAELNRKGKGTLTVMVEGEGYRVVWWQSGEEKSHLVARSLVELVWNEVISEFPISLPVPSREVGEKIVKVLENDHYNYSIMIHDDEEKYYHRCIKEGKWNHARSQNFDWSKFFGCRGDYHRLFYVPMKCLVALGWIEHRKDGHIIRLSASKSFDRDARLDEIILIENEIERFHRTPEEPEKITSWAESFN